MARIVVLGAGFAGLWAALGAARKRDDIGAAAADIEILVVDRNAYHSIRVRNYEVDLCDTVIPLAEVLDPVGVNHRVAEVEGVHVLNVNALANAVKPAVMPGEDLPVRVIQEGKEVGQGVGFLDDGTMIVVEGGARHIDKELDVSVTRVLQTVAGRMIFAQPRLD